MDEQICQYPAAPPRGRFKCPRRALASAPAMRGDGTKRRAAPQSASACSVDLLQFDFIRARCAVPLRALWQCEAMGRGGGPRRNRHPRAQFMSFNSISFAPDAPRRNRHPRAQSISFNSTSSAQSASPGCAASPPSIRMILRWPHAHVPAKTCLPSPHLQEGLPRLRKNKKATSRSRIKSVPKTVRIVLRMLEFPVIFLS